MFLTFYHSFRSDRSFSWPLKGDDVPLEVKHWALHRLYLATDWDYPYCDDSVSYNRGKHSVEVYWDTLHTVFPNTEDAIALHNSYASNDHRM